MTDALPTHADIIVIGGGIIGCSTAYHLARDHKANVIVLEQNKITSGSTWLVVRNHRVAASTHQRD